MSIPVTHTDKIAEVTINLLQKFFLNACAFKSKMRVAPQEQTQSVDYDGYPPAILGQVIRVRPAKLQNPERTN